MLVKYFNFKDKAFGNYCLKIHTRIRVLCKDGKRRKQNAAIIETPRLEQI